MPVKVTRMNHLPNLESRVKRLAQSDVLVGIPAANASKVYGGLNLAELLYIFSKGSPVNRIPPRPVLEPAIANDAKTIAQPMKAAAKAVFDGDSAAVTQNLNLAGQEASNACKEWFFNPKNGWAPNRPMTIQRKGSDRPGINTGEMRTAITFVVDEK